MKYSKLHTQQIHDLTEELCTLKESIEDLSSDANGAKILLADLMVEKEQLERKIISHQDSLILLLSQKQKELKRYHEIENKLDQGRFDGFHDRGESVEELPLGPVAIVPLGSSGLANQSIKWEDEDSPHAVNVNNICRDCKHNESNKRT